MSSPYVIDDERADRSRGVPDLDGGGQQRHRVRRDRGPPRWCTISTGSPSRTLRAPRREHFNPHAGIDHVVELPASRAEPHGGAADGLGVRATSRSPRAAPARADGPARTAGDRSRRRRAGSPPWNSMIAPQLLHARRRSAGRRGRGPPPRLSSRSRPAAISMRAASRTDSCSRSSGPRPLSVSIDSMTSSELPTRRPSGASMSVISASVRTPDALADRHERLGEPARVLRRLHERAAARLDVEDEAADALGDLLAHDRRADERNALDGPGDVAQRVELAIRRGDLGGLADQGAADRAERGAAARPATGPSGTPGWPRACRACRRCARARGPTSSARARRRPRRAARG